MPQLRLSNAIADAIAADIIAMRNEGLFISFAPMATATIEAKKKIPTYELKDLNTLRINSTPFSRASTRASRNTIDQELAVLLLVTMRAKDDTAFGQLTDFTDDLDELLASRRLIANGRSVAWASSDANPVYDIDASYDKNTFKSLIQVNYKALVN